MLLYDDYLTWCGSRLIAAVGPDRQSNLDSQLVTVAPPGLPARPIERAGKLSWVSPSCAPGGRVLAAAAGPNSSDAMFGAEDRSIWVLSRDGRVLRRLAEPPTTDLSDEAPRFSHDGRWIMFVRSQLLAAGDSDSSRDTIELVRTSGAGGAIPIISFTSGDFSYYDHYEWPYEVAWHSG